MNKTSKCPHCGRFMSVSKEELLSKIAVLEASNSLMEKELDHKRKQLDAVVKRCLNLRDRLFVLKSRGLLARILNR